MGTYEDDAPRLSEIGRMIGGIDRKMDDFRQEVRAALADKVSRETYVVERDTIKDRLSMVESGLVALKATLDADAQSRGKMITNVVYGAVGSLVVGIISAFLFTRG